jgi:hypothetical protein
VNLNVENTGRVASSWSLKQLDKLNHTAALESAKLLRTACNASEDFLSNPGIQATAEQVNQFLIHTLLSNLNPAVAAAVDVASGILDDVLQLPAGTMLTKAELTLLASFVRGLGKGCTDFIDGAPITKEPILRNSPRPRKWLHVAVVVQPSVVPAVVPSK